MEFHVKNKNSDSSALDSESLRTVYILWITSWSSVKETSKLILRRMGIRARNGLLVHGVIIDMRSTNQLILSEVLGNDAMKQ